MSSSSGSPAGDVALAGGFCVASPFASGICYRDWGAKRASSLANGPRTAAIVVLQYRLRLCWHANGRLGEIKWGISVHWIAAREMPLGSHAQQRSDQGPSKAACTYLKTCKMFTRAGRSIFKVVLRHEVS